MPTSTPTPDVGTLPARLRIHADGDDGGGGWSVDSLIQRLRADTRGALGDARMPWALEIHAPDGRRLLALDDVCARLETTLPAGTYCVTTRWGRTQQRHTVALWPGASVDLHLRLPPGGSGCI